MRDISIGERFVSARLPNGPLGLGLREYLEVGGRLEAQDGQERLQRARDQVERLIATTIGSLDAITLLLAARCISPRIWAILGEDGDMVQPGVRGTLELAIRKHAAWKPAARQIEELPSFLPGHLMALAKTFVYCEAYSGLMATERRVCKGEAQTVTCLAPLSFEADEGPLGRLIGIVDSRATGSADPLTAFGTVSEGEEPLGVPFILGADFVPPSEVIDYTGQYFAEEPTSNGRTVRTADRVTRWGFIEDIEAFQRAVAAYDTSLRMAAGYGLIDMHALEHLASIAILEHYAGRDLPPVLEVLGFAVVPPVFAVLIRDVAQSHPYDTMDPALVPTMASLSKAYARLVVSPRDIDLTNPTVIPPFIDLPGSGPLYDLAAASLFGPLYIEQTLDEDARQAFTKDFEARTHATVADLGAQPWSHGHPLRDGGEDITDVDASVQIGDVLVAIDCFSSPWNRYLDAGSHPKVRNRAGNLIDKVEDWQRQWGEIATDHADLLPPGVAHIFPVVVTARPEWISSEEPHLWLGPNLPAILTVHELHDHLTGGTLTAAHLIAVR